MSVSLWLTVGGDVRVISADYIKSGGITTTWLIYTLWVLLTLTKFVPLFVCSRDRILSNHGLHVSVGDYRANCKCITVHHIYPHVRGRCLFETRRSISISFCFSVMSWCQTESSRAIRSIQAFPHSLYIQGLEEKRPDWFCFTCSTFLTYCNSNTWKAHEWR